MVSMPFGIADGHHSKPQTEGEKRHANDERLKRRARLKKMWKRERAGKSVDQTEEYVDFRSEMDEVQDRNRQNRLEKRRFPVPADAAMILVESNDAQLWNDLRGWDDPIVAPADSLYRIRVVWFNELNKRYTFDLSRKETRLLYTVLDICQQRGLICAAGISFLRACRERASNPLEFRERETFCEQWQNGGFDLFAFHKHDIHVLEDMKKQLRDVLEGNTKSGKELYRAPLNVDEEPSAASASQGAFSIPKYTGLPGKLALDNLNRQVFKSQGDCAGLGFDGSQDKSTPSQIAQEAIPWPGDDRGGEFNQFRRAYIIEVWLQVQREYNGLIESHLNSEVHQRMKEFLQLVSPARSHQAMVQHENLTQWVNSIVAQNKVGSLRSHEPSMTAEKRKEFKNELLAKVKSLSKHAPLWTADFPTR